MTQIIKIFYELKGSIVHLNQRGDTEMYKLPRVFVVVERVGLN